MGTLLQGTLTIVILPSAVAASEGQGYNCESAWACMLLSQNVGG